MTPEEARQKVSDIYGPEFVPKMERVAKLIREANTPAKSRLAISEALQLWMVAEAKADGIDAVILMLRPGVESDIQGEPADD